MWFQEMNRRGVTLFVHPVPAKASRPVDLGIDVSILEFMFDTTRMLTNMIFSGAKNRFSKIKIISTHGGGTIPYLMTRIETLDVRQVEHTEQTQGQQLCRKKWRESSYAELRQITEALNGALWTDYAGIRIAPAWCGRKEMTLKIEKCPEDQKTIFRLSGRMRFDGLLELKRQLDGVGTKPVLDLKEVIHVDLEVVHFLGRCVQQGIELRNCAGYIREWIQREQGHETDG
jgi:hypothetical protein